MNKTNALEDEASPVATQSAVSVNVTEYYLRSPVYAARWTPATLVDQLFDGELGLKACKAGGEVFQLPKSELLRKHRDLADFEFISPQCSKEGRVEHRFIIVEPHATPWEALGQAQADYAERLSYIETMKHQALAIFWCLSVISPLKLALVVDAGHDARQGWFVRHKRTAQELRGFYRCAAMFGIENLELQGEELARMPNGLGSDGRRQTAIYFDPFALPGVRRRFMEVRHESEKLAVKLGLVQPEALPL